MCSRFSGNLLWLAHHRQGHLALSVCRTDASQLGMCAQRITTPHSIVQKLSIFVLKVDISKVLHFPTGNFGPPNHTQQRCLLQSVQDQQYNEKESLVVSGTLCVRLTHQANDRL
jgi:hypothetical protein